MAGDPNGQSSQKYVRVLVVHFDVDGDEPTRFYREGDAKPEGCHIADWWTMEEGENVKDAIEAEKAKGTNAN